MALQIDYFAAASDEEAAATVNLESGLRSLPFDDESASPTTEYDVVASQDVDPGIALGYLNELLTGVTVEEFVTSGWPAPVAVSDDEQKFVLQVDPGFVALMSTREAPFDELAAQWAAAEAPEDADEWNPRPRDLADFLEGFVALALKSGHEGKHVYCWLWP
ncbi:hypothetical protein H7F30_00680 [Dermacoccus sp. PAMC28757]|uniref:DUF1877 family protein n=1 Tax=Dermacoccus abyssi TaxID=322596 RepID=A0ABX5Z6B3_9MICO|nr:hypothetical protein [Dermacoccus sp. PAMC28757]QEH92471.1 hypothetical protein FV141_02150 [Dermacoccus abyssi]QNK52904.1 hypothetical protein H7F30_00680 [Dermacoccus sp. PAMC28757]